MVHEAHHLYGYTPPPAYPCWLFLHIHATMRPAREPVHGVMRGGASRAEEVAENDPHTRPGGFTMVSKRGRACGVSSALEDVRAAP